jgi:hypothetical protein
VPTHGRPRAIFGLGHTNIPAVELLTIEFHDGLCNGCRVRKRDESETSRATGDPVNRQKHLGDVSHLRKEAGEFALGSIKTEVSDKYFCADDLLLSTNG